MLLGDNQGQPTFTSLYRAVCGQLLQVSTRHTFQANVFPLNFIVLIIFVLQGPFVWGGVLLVDAVCWRSGVYQNNGVNIHRVWREGWYKVIMSRSDWSTWLLSVTEYTEKKKKSECLRLTKMLIRGLLISELIRIWKCCHKLKRQTRWFLCPVVTPKKSKMQNWIKITKNGLDMDCDERAQYMIYELYNYI